VKNIKKTLVGVQWYSVQFSQPQFEITCVFCIFLQLSSSCCAVSMIPKILFDHLCTKHDQEWQVNNYAKFVLLPLLLALGMNYAWLDIDIFVVQNPTSRLLQLADVLSADVLTTDHFDESCLNHGATCHDLPILVCFIYA